jgi:hypothetical protein
MSELIEELSLGSARGRRSGAPVSVEVVRSLQPEDLELLASPPAVGTGPSIPQIRHQHHQLAGLIAKGLPGTEISLITGFSPSYISMLKNSPDMKELVDYYQQQAEERTVDALARLRNLGVTSVEELQNRLNEAPEKFTAGQLMDMVEIGLIKPMDSAASRQAGSANGSGIQINLNFKAPEGAVLAQGPGHILEAVAK